MMRLSNGVNGMMRIKLKMRIEYFRFTNLENIFMNDMKKPLYSILLRSP